MKDFKIKAEQIVRLIGPVGTATATDMIMVEGRDIGYMYREDPINDVDTGWRFFAGDESDAYIEDNNNTGFYEINTIANYHPSIIARLDESVGTAWDGCRGPIYFVRWKDEASGCRLPTCSQNSM